VGGESFLHITGKKNNFCSFPRSYLDPVSINIILKRGSLLSGCKKKGKLPKFLTLNPLYREVPVGQIKLPPAILIKQEGRCLYFKILGASFANNN